MYIEYIIDVGFFDEIEAVLAQSLGCNGGLLLESFGNAEERDREWVERFWVYLL